MWFSGSRPSVVRIERNVGLMYRRYNDGRKHLMKRRDIVAT
jgi:hypothetical protein